MSKESKKCAVVLVSGGLDSATTLAIAKSENYKCYALSFDYGQRHAAELMAADEVCTSIGVAEHDGGDFDTTFKKADNALYSAKTGGRNRVECFER